MDELEKTFRQNQSRFDDQEPNVERMWKHIIAELPAQKPVRRTMFSPTLLKIAAGFLLIAVIGGVFMTQSQTKNNMIVEHSELRDINSYYSQLISFKVEQVKTSNVLTNNDKQEFLTYFNELETECKKLESDLTMQLDNEQVLVAIVDNYRQRLNLLENLLRRLTQSKDINDEKSIAL